MGDISAAREALERQIRLNTAISDEGLTNPWGAQVGKTPACKPQRRCFMPGRGHVRAAGSDARMNGCSMPGGDCVRARATRVSRRACRWWNTARKLGVFS